MITSTVLKFNLGQFYNYVLLLIYARVTYLIIVIIVDNYYVKSEPPQFFYGV